MSCSFLCFLCLLFICSSVFLVLFALLSVHLTLGEGTSPYLTPGSANPLGICVFGRVRPPLLTYCRFVPFDPFWIRRICDFPLWETEPNFLFFSKNKKKSRDIFSVFKSHVVYFFFNLVPLLFKLSLIRQIRHQSLNHYNIGKASFFYTSFWLQSHVNRLHLNAALHRK